MPESRGRKRSDYTPPPEKGERKVMKLGSAPWVAPTMVACFIIGLLWIVVFYIAGPSIPVMNALSPLVNVVIGFAFITAGFVISTRWR